MPTEEHATAHGPVVYVSYPPGYGLHVAGLVIPFPPAPVLWALMALDLAATVWALSHPSRWPLLAAGMAVSLYMILVGVFSVGPIFALLFLVQAILVIRHRARRAPHQTRP